MQSPHSLHFWLTTHTMFQSIQSQQCPEPVLYTNFLPSAKVLHVYVQAQRAGLIHPMIQPKDCMFQVMVTASSSGEQVRRKTRKMQKEECAKKRKQIMQCASNITQHYEDFEITLEEILQRQLAESSQIRRGSYELRIYIYWSTITFRQTGSSISLLRHRGQHFQVSYMNAVAIDPELTENLEKIEIKFGPHLKQYHLKERKVLMRVPAAEEETGTGILEVSQGSIASLQTEIRQVTIPPEYKIGRDRYGLYNLMKI